MNDITPTPSSPSPKRHHTLILFLVLIFSSFTLLWQQITRFHQELQQQIDILNRQVTDLKAELQAILTEDEQEDQEDDLETRLQPLLEQQQHLETRLTTLSQQIQKKPRDEDWLFAEIVYLLTIAHYRVVLAQDFEGALRILQWASKELDMLNKPLLLQVKSQLAKDMGDLNKLSQVHLTQAATDLVHYVTQAERLPLLPNFSQPASSPPKEEVPQVDTWQDFGPVIWKQVKTLVTVRYNPHAELGLLTPEQHYFIRQSLKLKLEMAHFCLLHRDAKNFFTFLQAASQWLTHYYNLQDQEVQTLQKNLETLQSIDLAPSLPDLYETLKLFQQQFTSEKFPQ